MKVAITARAVFPIHGRGGLERSVYDLARHLAAEGVQVTLVTRTPETVSSPDAIDGRIRLQFVPYRTFPLAGRRGTTVLDRSTAYPLFGIRAGKAAAALVQAGEADVVHGFGASVLGYARRRRSLGAPLVLNPQGLEEFGATAPARAPLKRIGYYPLQRAVLTCARHADAIIATDAALVPAVREHLHAADEKIVTIPNALDLPALDALASAADGIRIRRAAGIGDEEVVILSVGRLEANKGFHVLAAALSALKEHSGRLAHDPWRWVIVGTGPYDERLRRTIERVGLAANTLFPGSVTDEDLHAWYEAATLFVHPTLYEGSSLVTLEAMAHRKACVVTDAGGLPDKVETGLNGWLVAAGDASALAGAISGALAQPERLVRLGLEGRRIVERRFSWSTAVRDTIRLYERLLSRP